MSASNYLELKILDSVLGSNALYTRPATVYAALYNGALTPVDAEDGQEPEQASYARVAITNNATNWPAAASKIKKNGQNITFPTPGENWDLIPYTAIYDALTLGNILVYSSLTTPRTVLAGDVVRFETDSFKIRMDDVGSRISTYLANKMLDHIFGGPSWTRPGTVHLALFDDTLTDQASIGTSVNEISGGAYARLAITNNNTNFPSASSGEKHNANALAFVEATANWDNVGSWGIYDASTSGNLLFFGNFITPRTVLNGDVFSIPVGELSISCD